MRSGILEGGVGRTAKLHNDKGTSAKKPDECYCIGTDKEIPGLAIEVVYTLRVQQFAQVGEPAQRNCFTSGGVDTLEIYRRLGVRKVWIWQNNQLQVYCLQDDNYQQKQQSKLLPNLNLTLLAQYHSY